MALAETVVDVVANTDPFERDFERAMLRAGRRAGRAIDVGLKNHVRQTGRSVGRRIAQDVDQAMGRSIRTSTHRVAGRIDGSGFHRAGYKAGRAWQRGFEAAVHGQTMGERIGRQIARGLGDAAASGAGGGRGGGRFFRLGQAAGDSWSNGFRAAVRRRRVRFAADVIKWLGIGTAVLTAIPAVVTGLGALTTAMGAAAGAAVALTSAMAPLSGVFAGFPAAVAGVAAGVGTLRVAFRGIDDAVEQALTGSLDDFRDAIEDLAPAAQRSMRELRGMRSVFDQLQHSVQGEFFGQILGDLEALSDVISGPLQRGMSGLATEFGRVASILLEFGQTDRAADAINRVFGSLQRAMRAASSGLEPALRGIADAVIALAPQFERLGEAIGEFLTAWGEDLSSRALSGQLVADFEDALDTARQLQRIASNLLDTFLAVGTAIERAFGGDILEAFERATERLRNWSLSPQVQGGITAIFADLRRAVEALEPAFRQLGRSAVQLVDALADAVTRAGPGLVPILEGLGDGLSALARGAGEFIRQAGPGLGEFLRQFGKALGDLLAGAGAGFGEGFLNLAEALEKVDWKRVGEDLGVFFETLTQLVDDLAVVADRILEIAGVVAKAMNMLTGGEAATIGEGPRTSWPGQIGIGTGLLNLQKQLNKARTQLQMAFGNLGQGVVDAVQNLWNFLVVGLEIAGAFFSNFGRGLTNRLRNLWNFLVVGLEIAGAFFSNFGRGLVDRLRGLWLWMQVGLGRVGQFFAGFGSGLVSAVQSLWAWLQPVLDSVAGFFDQLGAGISGIAAGLFGGGIGPWLPGMARGGVVTRATPAVVGEAGPEVVIPLRRPARARQLAAQSGLMDMLTPDGVSGSARPAGGRTSRVGGGAPTPHRTAHVHAPITVTTAATDPDIVAARIAARVTRQVRGAVS